MLNYTRRSSFLEDRKLLYDIIDMPQFLTNFYLNQFFPKFYKIILFLIKFYLHTNLTAYSSFEFISYATYIFPKEPSPNIFFIL